MENLKTFYKDFEKFHNKIKEGIHFSLVRYGDGELCIMEGNKINLLKKGAGEFAYSPNDYKYEKARKLLIESFKHRNSNYFVGIGCKCCIGLEKFNQMKELSQQSESNLTWANIFVNSNYKYFISELLPTIKDKKIVIICNNKSKIDNLPFNNFEVYRIGKDAWINNTDVFDKVKNITDAIFLISAGPLANILIYKLHGSNNTFLDIGSTLDPFLKLPITRGYLKGKETINKTCVW